MSISARELGNVAVSSVIAESDVVVESPSPATCFWLIMVGVDRSLATIRATVAIGSTGLNRAIATVRSRIHVLGSSVVTRE